VFDDSDTGFAGGHNVGDRHHLAVSFLGTHASPTVLVVRALLLANRSDCDPGLVGSALRARGYAFTEYLREDHGTWLPDASTDSLAAALDGADLIVSMGSGWSTYWPGVAEPVGAEAALVREGHRRDIPILGICFGAQMLSTALGGTVDKTPHPEIGWHDIASSTAEALPSPLQGPWMQWHYDRFSVPDGFSLLAQSPAGPQVIHRDRSVGVQFHPEATESIVARWCEGTGLDELAARGIDPGQLLERTRAEMASAGSRCRDLVDWFCETVA
jgi:GMP synthase-like glutamine amidotransferase